VETDFREGASPLIVSAGHRSGSFRLIVPRDARLRNGASMTCRTALSPLPPVSELSEPMIEVRQQPVF
jgi:hypothetical protein